MAETKRLETTPIGGSSASPTPLFDSVQPGGTLAGRFLVQEVRQIHDSSRPGVYVCVDRETNSRVVVKVAAADYPPDPKVWAQMPRLAHPALVKVREVFRDSAGRHFEVQEFVEGKTLASLGKCTGFDWMRKDLVPALNGALRHLHANGIVHRDVKPENIFLKAEGARTRVFLADLDVSMVLPDGRSVRETVRMTGATWAYAAPESLAVPGGGAGLETLVGAAADYYSLGQTLYTLIAGKALLAGYSLPEIFRFHLSGQEIVVPTRDVPEDFQLLLRGLLVRDRRHRWGADEVDRWLAGRTTDSDRSKAAPAAPTPAAWKMRFAGRDVKSPAELAAALLSEPEEALRRLQGGERGPLLSEIGKVDADLQQLIVGDLSASVRGRRPEQVDLWNVVWRLDPDLPYEVSPGRRAKTPGEIARSVYGIDADWARGVPVFYEEARKRALDGYLAAWLRCRGLADVARRCTAELDVPAAQAGIAFEKVLRRLDPSLPKVRVALSARPVEVELNGHASIEVRFRTLGPGVPFAVVTADDPHGHVHVRTPLIDQREGSIVVEIVPRGDARLARRYSPTITLGDGNAVEVHA